MKVAIFVLLLSPIISDKQTTPNTLKLPEGKPAAKAELSQFQFLQGAWAGSGFGAKCDESWSHPAGDCILGTFRMVKDNELQFTEFCMIQRDDSGRVVLRLKHFTPEFHGWEEKKKYISFSLVKIEKNKAYFDGLTYALQPDGSLRIWVALEQEDGTLSEEAFHLKPAK